MRSADAGHSWRSVDPREVRITLSDAPITDMPAHLTCWSQPIFALVDAETGERYGDGPAGGVIGPLVTNEEQQALTRFAWAEGWWELWQRLRAFAGEPLPEGLAASLDRPDAPAPTPIPVPAMPADATPTPTSIPRMTALLIGMLVERDGCLSVNVGSEAIALVWSEGQHVARRNDSTIEITDVYTGRTRTVTWRLGQEVALPVSSGQVRDWYGNAR